VQDLRSKTKLKAAFDMLRQRDMYLPGHPKSDMWPPTIRSRIEELDIKSRKSMAKRAWAVAMGTFGGLYLGAMTTDLENFCCI
jgi:hypothetical protein